MLEICQERITCFETFQIKYVEKDSHVLKHVYKGLHVLKPCLQHVGKDFNDFKHAENMSKGTYVL